MKLREWADRQGITYLTAWRWFKAKDPRLSKAYKSSSGAIIVPDENDLEETQECLMQTSETINDNYMLPFLEKVTEFTLNNGTIAGFASWVLANYTLVPEATDPIPPKRKQIPRSMAQYYQKLIKPRGKKPEPNMFLVSEEELDKVFAQAEQMEAEELKAAQIKADQPQDTTLKEGSNEEAT